MIGAGILAARVALSALASPDALLDPPRPALVASALGERGTTDGGLRFYAGTLREAREAARERNVPVVLVVILEDPAPDVVEFRQRVVLDRELGAASRDALVVLTNNGEHGSEEVERTVEGETALVQRCPAYQTATCAGHRAPWEPIYRAYQVDGVLTCPQVLVTAPDGGILARLATRQAPPSSEIVRAVRRARETLGPGQTFEEVAQLRRLRDEATRAAGKGRSGAAWRAWAEFLGVARAPAPVQEGEAGRARALQAMRASVSAALARVAAGEVVEAYADLQGLAGELADTPLERDIAKHVRELERGKATRDAVRAYRDELSADELWREIEQHLEQGRADRAERQARALIRRYPKTAAARRARERFSGDGAAR